MRKILVALAGGTLVMALALPAGASTTVSPRGGHSGNESHQRGGHVAHRGCRDHRDRNHGRHHRNGRDRYYPGYCEGYGYPDYDYDDYNDDDYGGYGCCRY